MCTIVSLSYGTNANIRTTQRWIKLGGRFTFSDDSHGIAQVATNYTRGLDYLRDLGVEEVWTLRRTPHPGVVGGAKSELVETSVPISKFRAALKTSPA